MMVALKPTFWPLLSVLQKGGFFPCKKVKDSETEKVSMQPVNGFIQFMSYMLCTTFSFGLFACGLHLLHSDQDKKVLDFLIKFFEDGAAMQHSAFDLKVFMALNGFLTVTHFAMLSRMIVSKGKLCDVYNYFLENAHVDFKIITTSKKLFYFEGGSCSGSSFSSSKG